LCAVMFFLVYYYYKVMKLVYKPFGLWHRKPYKYDK